MKTNVLSLHGKEIRKIELPSIFQERYLPEVIKRAFIAKQSESFQPHGTKLYAGLFTSAEYIGRRRAFRAGINIGRARLPRIKLGGGGLGDVRRVPQARKGIRAHPPKTEKLLVKKINKKERNLAIRSAIATTANKELVKARGHKFNSVPLVVEDSFQSIKKTKEAIVILEALGLKNEKSLLIVLDKEDGKAFRNIPGIDVCTVDSLDIDLLAPGGRAGRLAIWTESAIKKLQEGSKWC